MSCCLSLSILQARELFNPTDTTIIDLTLCIDECVIINNTEYCDGGVFEDLLIGSDGCDSLLIITIEKIIPIYLNFFLCEGDCFEIPEIDSLFCPPSGGFYSFEVGPCPDGIQLFVDQPAILPTIYAFACLGECIVLPSFTPDSLIICPTSDTTLLIPVDGFCPIPDTATIQISVTGAPTLDSLIYYRSCPGECVEFDGGTFCNDFSTTFHFTSSGGCDSSIYFELNIHSVDDDTIQLGLCENSCVTWGNMEFCEPMIYSDSLISVDGCDSAVFIIVDDIVSQTDLLPGEIILDLSESYTFDIAYDNFSVSWNSGVDSNLFVFQAADYGEGTHFVSAILEDLSTGCILNSDTTVVTVVDPLSTSLITSAMNIRTYPKSYRQSSSPVCSILRDDKS